MDAKQIENIIKSLQTIDTSLDLKTIFSSPFIMNTIFKNKELFKAFINYIVITRNNEIIYDKEFNNYYRQILPDDKILDDYYFYNGEYTNCNLKNLNSNQINEILLFNNKKTQDEYYNKIFDMIKDYDIFDYKFPFNTIYLNAKQQEYKFGFLKQFYTLPDKKQFENLRKVVIEPVEDEKYIRRLYDNQLLNYDLTFGDSYILQYNYNNPAFKKAFYYLCSRHLTEQDLNVEKLLNAFLNFESIFCSKNVIPNEDNSSLITYIYFKASQNICIPNLRYTLDIEGKDNDEKIKWLDECSNQNIVDDLKAISPLLNSVESIGFDTKIISDDKGYYFSTTNFNISKILKNIQSFIDLCKYDEMLYYIFKSQCLSRSTCLFGYYMYYIFTGMIPDEKLYYDIIALTSSFETFKSKLKFKKFNFKYNMKQISLNNLIDFVMKEEK